MSLLKKILFNIEEYICVITLLAMSLLNFTNILSRYFLHFSFSFTEEILMILFLWCIMFGIIAGFKRGVHLGFSMIEDHLQGYKKVAVMTFSALATCAFIGVLIYSSSMMIQSEIAFNQTTPVMKIPEVYATISIPVASCIAIIRILVKLYQETKQVRGAV